jgi:two-component system sensor histidine kinase PilS (NtrC family)
MADNDLQRKLGRLIGVRAVISTILLGGATFAQIRAPGSFPVNPFFALVAVTYALTVAYALTLRLAESRRWLIDLQLAADALIVSAFIYLTGGVTSVFASLYVLPIAAASAVQFRRGGLLVATLSTIIFAGIVLAQYLADAGLLDPVWAVPNATALPARSVAQYIVALNAFGFVAVALLSGSLAETVRSAGAKLEIASTHIEDLQALNQHVINSLPSGLVTTDTSQRVLTFNQAAQVITGDLPEDVIGRPVAEVLQLPPSLLEELSSDVPDAGTRPQIRYRTSDGRGEIDIGLRAAHLKTPSGRAGFLITFQDVTNVVKLERDARIQQRLAAVGEMAAGIAHEIRNPLASMSGSIQILRQELPLTTEQEQLMDIVLRESERLNTTINSFLAYARPRRFAIERIDVRRAVQDTALLLRNSAEVRDGHSIEVDLPVDELWYEADEGQLKQIVWNLATNGLRAMRLGGQLRLSASPDLSTDGVVMRVQDQGVGIPPEQIDGLFQPFHGTFAKGAGLGLAIVHRIVRDYQGEVQVSSHLGAGTTVSVHLPVRAAVTA